MRIYTHLKFQNYINSILNFIISTNDDLLVDPSGKAFEKRHNFV